MFSLSYLLNTNLLLKKEKKYICQVVRKGFAYWGRTFVIKWKAKKWVCQVQVPLVLATWGREAQVSPPRINPYK